MSKLSRIVRHVCYRLTRAKTYLATVMTSLAGLQLTLTPPYNEYCSFMIMVIGVLVAFMGGANVDNPDAGEK